jgi:hypothetical protein
MKMYVKRVSGLCVVYRDNEVIGIARPPIGEKRPSDGQIRAMVKFAFDWPRL